jgi:hypothetical protein
MNFASRLINVFVAPQATFEAEKQKSLWYVPMIVFLILTMIGTLWLRPVTRQIAQNQQEKIVERMENQGAPQEQIDKVRERMQKKSGAWEIVPPLATQVIFLLIVAAIWFFASNMLIGGAVKYAQMISVTAYSWLVVAVGMLIKAPIMLAKSSISVHFSPATFLSNDKAFIYKFLAQFDLFSIWCFFIVTIGIAIMTSRKTEKVWPITAIFFVIYFLGAAAVQSAFGF